MTRGPVDRSVLFSWIAFWTRHPWLIKQVITNKPGIQVQQQLQKTFSNDVLHRGGRLSGCAGKLEETAQTVLLLAKVSQHHMFLFGNEVHVANTEKSVNILRNWNRVLRLTDPAGCSCLPLQRQTYVLELFGGVYFSPFNRGAKLTCSRRLIWDFGWHACHMFNFPCYSFKPEKGAQMSRAVH